MDKINNQHEVAEEFIQAVENDHPQLVPNRTTILSLALLRAAKEIMVFRASDKALEDLMLSSPGQTQQDGSGQAQLSLDSNPPEPSVSSSAAAQVKPFSASSDVICPNCGRMNELDPSPYLRYLCFGCGYCEPISL